MMRRRLSLQKSRARHNDTYDSLVDLAVIVGELKDAVEFGDIPDNVVEEVHRWAAQVYDEGERLLRRT